MDLNILTKEWCFSKALLYFYNNAANQWSLPSQCKFCKFILFRFICIPAIFLQCQCRLLPSLCGPLLIKAVTTLSGHNAALTNPLNNSVLQFLHLREMWQTAIIFESANHFPRIIIQVRIFEHILSIWKQRSCQSEAASCPPVVQCFRNWWHNQLVKSSDWWHTFTVSCKKLWIVAAIQCAEIKQECKLYGPP